MSSRAPTDTRWAWQAALGCMLLAALTGVLYRWGLVTGQTFGLGLGDIRHAHSHLMYLGWVTPAVMALLAARIGGRGERGVGALAHLSLAGALLAALVSWPLYARFGYRPTAVGDAMIPLAAATSGLAMLAWYGWCGWWALRSRIGREPADGLWHLAHGQLLVSTLGAWSLAVGGAVGAPDLVREVGKHVFLDVFAEGWLVLAVLGLAWSDLGGPRLRRGVLALLALSVPLAVPLTMPLELVSTPARVVSGLASVATGAAVLHLVGSLWSRRDAGWTLPLALLGCKAAAQIVAGALPLVGWGELHGLRILYLHVTLLGGVSLGLVAAAEHGWGRLRGAVPVRGAVLFLLATLLPLTGPWPDLLAGPWVLRAALAGAVVVTVAVAALLFGGRSVASGRALPAARPEGRSPHRARAQEGSPHRAPPSRPRYGRMP